MRPKFILSRWGAVVRSAGALALATALLPVASWAQSAPDCATTCTACAPCGTLCTDNSGTSPALSACALQPSPTCSWLQPCSTVCTSAALCSTKCVDTSVPACTQSSPETTCGQMPGSQDICQQPSGQLLEEMSFYHQDHLGSVRMITDAQGAVVSRHDYLPFGEEIPAGQFGRTSAAGYSASDLAPQRFTGKERDFESQLDYFGARYYSGAMGRFTSADPGNAAAEVGDPQSWNAYAYVTNNPLRKVDPDGEKGVDLAIGAAIGVGKTVATAVVGTLLIVGEGISRGGAVPPVPGSFTSMAIDSAVDDAKMLGYGFTHPGEVADQYVRMSVSDNDADQRQLGEAFGTGAAIAAMVMAPSAKGAPAAVRPAAKQPAGGAGVVLADGSGATPAEMAASRGGPTAGQRVSSSLRRQMLAETPEGQPYRCWRCGRTSTNPADMHVGHRNVARSNGGNLSRANVCLEGAACNLGAGDRGAPSPGMSCAERGSCGAPYGR